VNRVSVVTGAAGSMGAACARARLLAGDALVLHDRDEARLRVVLDEWRDTGLLEHRAAVTTVVGDVADPHCGARLAEAAADLGAFRALVHTAGLSPTMDSWRAVLEVDLVAVARLLDAFRPLVGPGSVAVCIASMAGHLGEFDPAVDAVLDEPLGADLADRLAVLLGGEPDAGTTYRLAKRAVLRLCERSAGSWGAHGGRVVSVSPGLIDTTMGRRELEHQPVKVWMAEHTPVGGVRPGGESILPGRIDDVVDAVEFCCSERAAFVSGCDLRVDGGLSAVMNHGA
jgi:NAD(P)-dependent dehydrogenase (short-subunit alcohol dehydrogenase family)